MNTTAADRIRIRGEILTSTHATCSGQFAQGGEFCAARNCQCDAGHYARVDGFEGRMALCGRHLADLQKAGMVA